MDIKERFRHFLEYNRLHNPQAETELNYNNPYELLVAVILSAQCTDKRVNMVTPTIFQQYPSAELMATATFDELFPLVRTVSYPNNKTKHLIGMAQMLIQDFKGEVPGEIDQLVKLPGVGRKTANVIASVVFNKPAMAVDTHVFRVSARVGLTKGAKTPLETEKQLVKHIPEADIPNAHHWLILHGRYVCVARTPKCYECKWTHFCKYFETLAKQPEGSVQKTVKSKPKAPSAVLKTKSGKPGKSRNEAG